MKKSISVIVFIIALLVMLVGCGENVSIKTEYYAIKIAKDNVLEKYDNSFSEYEITADSEENLWIVNYSPKQTDESTFILGGGGPTVKIQKSNGKVVSCYLQK